MGRNRKLGLEKRGRPLGTCPWDASFPGLLCFLLTPWGNSSTTGVHGHKSLLHDGPWPWTELSETVTQNIASPWICSHQVVSADTKAQAMCLFTHRVAHGDRQLPLASNCLVQNTNTCESPGHARGGWVSPLDPTESHSNHQGSCWRNCLKCTYSSLHEMCRERKGQ